MRGLVAQSALVEEITDEAEAEDGRGKSVACRLAIATEGASEELGAIFCWETGLDCGRGGGQEPVRARTSAGDDAGERETMVSIPSCGIPRLQETTYFQKVGLKAMAAAETVVRAVSKLRVGKETRFWPGWMDATN